MRSIPMERMLAAYCRERKMRFVVMDSPEPAIRLLMPEAFLPVLALQAELTALTLFRPVVSWAESGDDQVPLIDEVLARARHSRSDDHDGERDELPLGTRLHDDAKALFGVFASVRPLTGDGRGGLCAALFTHALHQVFGYQSGTVDVSAVFARYAHSAEPSAEPTGEDSLRSILRAMSTAQPKETNRWPPATVR
jgi:hypothetical protein